MHYHNSMLTSCTIKVLSKLGDVQRVSTFSGLLAGATASPQSWRNTSSDTAKVKTAGSLLWHCPLGDFFPQHKLFSKHSKKCSPFLFPRKSAHVYVAPHWGCQCLGLDWNRDAAWHGDQRSKLAPNCSPRQWPSSGCKNSSHVFPSALLQIPQSLSWCFSELTSLLSQFLTCFLTKFLCSCFLL